MDSAYFKKDIVKKYDAFIELENIRLNSKPQPTINCNINLLDYDAPAFVPNHCKLNSKKIDFDKGKHKNLKRLARCIFK
jgi:hypothetical protein